MRLLLFAAAVAAFALPEGSASGAQPRASRCEFRYTDEVQKEAVIPALKQRFGSGYRYFDFDKPVIYDDSNPVVVQLSATRSVDGETLQFEDLFFVEIDSCNKKVVKTYVTTQYHRE